jgi:hypothetical protein
MAVRDKIIYIANQELGGADNRDIQDVKELDKYFKETGKSPYGADKETSWCGIFACWVLWKAGVGVSWGINQNNSFGIISPAGGQVELVDPKSNKGEGIRPGDVGVIVHRNHHFIVEQSYMGVDTMVTISGNYMGRKHDCIRRTREYTKSGLWYFYRVLAN